jgi:hypothetical protein
MLYPLTALLMSRNMTAPGACSMTVQKPVDEIPEICNDPGL